MHRAVTVAMVLAVLAGSVPAAASLAQQSPSDAEPGASFAGVVGVQESEVNSEVASRSLNQRLNAAGTNESKASVVANESEQLEQRLAELEAEKARLKQAYENGSISKGEYQARLAVLAAELRSVERQANQTADAAETLPEEALREKGANVSEVRAIAQQANRTGGGEVAQAARNITGGGVGNGLGNAPPNASERGPPNDPNGSEGGPPGEAGGENATDRKPTDAGPPSDAGNDTGAPGDAGNNTGGPGDAGNETGAPSDAGNETNQPADAGNSSDASDNGNTSDRGNASDDGGANETDRSGNDSGQDGSDTANRSTEADNGSSDAGNGDDGSGSDGNGDGNDNANDGSQGNESSEGNNASDKGNSNETANESDGNQLSERMTVPTDRNTAFEFSPVEMLDWIDPVSRTILG